MTKLASNGTPFFCQVVDVLGESGIAGSGIIQARLMNDGKIILEFVGDEGQFTMPNWPFASNPPSSRYTITGGGGCPGAPVN